MLRWSLSWLLGLCFVASAHAQSTPYNPYAPQREDPSPIKPDGRLNWPAFFRSQKMENRFQSYFAIGACMGTKKSIVDKLKHNKVDVNELPEAPVAGRVLTVKPGVVTLVDASRQTIAAVIHPAGVSKVEVVGKIPVGALSPDMFVRLQGAVDAHGQGLQTLESLEVLTPGPDLKPQAVVPGRVQTILAVVTKLEGKKLRLQVAPGTLHRLTFPVTETTTVHVDARVLSLISPGDEISAKGHVYVGEGGLAAKTLFVSEIKVKKAFSPAAPSAVSATAGSLTLAD